MGAPSRPAIHPPSMFAPTRLASCSLFPAMADVAASNSRNGSDLAGAAMAIGLVPIRGSAPNVGSTSSPPAVAVMPTISACAASIAWCPIAPECPALYMVTTPTPTSRALSMAMFMALGPRMTARPRSASTVAVDGDSRTIRMSGLGLERALGVSLNVGAQHVPRRRVFSTPRRSVATSTSAPSSASSCVTPIFSKIDATVSCNASCGTRRLVLVRDLESL